MPGPWATPRRVNHRVDGGVLFRNLPVPGQVHIIERPGVLERRSGSFTTDRRAVGLVRVKRRVEVDQVHARAVHAAHDVEVVSRPHRAVHPVRGTHAGGMVSPMGWSHQHKIIIPFIFSVFARNFARVNQRI